ncbi:hypothetical protein PC112_g5018 [Phytophthora cactorum]|nr:hypothetical protein PC112_g5018 [Phytophthora cactorum]KAG3193364.1 hypothetical protein C6341_g197 [Phytophthora cactorum]
MQRYSVQLSYKTRKYYKTLSLGLLDVTFVSAYIVYPHHRKTNGKSSPKHFAFFEELMEQLLAVDPVEAFAEIEVRFYNISGSSMRTGMNGAVASER